jgi:hypothetical protein
MQVKFTDEDIRAEAERLGLVTPGGEMPRHLRSRVVAVLIERQTQAAPGGSAAEPQLAKEIVIQPGGVILIDGETFPWLVAREPMDIRVSPDAVSTVRLTLMAGTVQVLKTEPHPESE